MIGTRPAEVETRLTVGHWEGDLINGAHGTGNLATLVERNTRLRWSGARTARRPKRSRRKSAACSSRYPKGAVSVTLNNGKEFAQHEEIAKDTVMDVFFANPYHSWERGTNENTNGLIRRLHPKQSSFAGIGRRSSSVSTCFSTTVLASVWAG